MSYMRQATTSITSISTISSYNYQQGVGSTVAVLSRSRSAASVAA